MGYRHMAAAERIENALIGRADRALRRARSGDDDTDYGRYGAPGRDFESNPEQVLDFDTERNRRRPAGVRRIVGSKPDATAAPKVATKPVAKAAPTPEAVAARRAEPEPPKFVAPPPKVVPEPLVKECDYCRYLDGHAAWCSEAVRERREAESHQPEPPRQVLQYPEPPKARPEKPYTPPPPRRIKGTYEDPVMHRRDRRFIKYRKVLLRELRAISEIAFGDGAFSWSQDRVTRESLREMIEGAASMTSFERVREIIDARKAKVVELETRAAAQAKAKAMY